jgi:glutathione S-transferase
MILYGASMSPFVRKVLAYAAEKELEIELRPGGMGRGGAEFEEISPFGKMPGFRDEDFTISDSTAIITYLEAKHPEPNMIPIEPRARARTIWYEEFGDTIVMACCGKIFFNRVVAPRVMNRPGDLATAEAAERNELPPILDYLERTLPDSGFLIEDRITLADLAVASPFANLQHMDIRPDPDRHPKTAAYVDAILARPGFSRWLEKERAFVQGG